MTLVFLAASDDTVEESHLRISAWTSWACSVEATLPVPIALQREEMYKPEGQVDWGPEEARKARRWRRKAISYQTGS
jgi:hypothetical protein